MKIAREDLLFSCVFSIRKTVKITRKMRGMLLKERKCCDNLQNIQ